MPERNVTKIKALTKCVPLSQPALVMATETGDFKAFVSELRAGSLYGTFTP